jgi:RNA polymerase sigma-70 factor (ECF subfamily)
MEDRWEGGTVTADLLQRARTGDGSAFGELVEPHRRELHVHCYRILGSVADAEDALQDTLVSAWQALPRYEERASLRTWLYRIATNRCLSMLRSASRRPEASLPEGVEPPAPTRLGEIVWLEPYPDVMLDETFANPEARYEAKEAISLAFVTALQLLPPRQRAVLVLRDVLSYSAREVAGMLDATEMAVNSALKRARATLAEEMPRKDAPAPQPGSREEQELLSRLTEAFESRDVRGLVSLMTEDAWLRMPPVPLEYQGRELAGRFFEVVAFRAGRRYRLVPTRANGQPAFGVYLYDAHSEVGHAFGLLVFTLAGDRISTITRFDNSTLAAFGLPRTLAD